MQLALSTSFCCDGDSPAEIVCQWREVAGGWERVAAALDPRFGDGRQSQLLVALKAAGERCVEIAYPSLMRRTPSLAAADREERLAAAGRLTDVIHRAIDHGLGRVALPGVTLMLRTDWSELSRAFAEWRPLPWAALRRERAAAASRALDGLRHCLDAVLGLADRQGMAVVLPAPGPAPHHLPSGEENAQLVAQFAGAPLLEATATDSEQISATLKGDAATQQNRGEKSGLGLLGERATASDELGGTLEAGLREGGLSAGDLHALIAAGGADGHDSTGVDMARLVLLAQQRGQEVGAHSMSGGGLVEASPDRLKSKAAQGEYDRLIRVADASGLVGGLPIGAGEIDWSGRFQSLSGAEALVLEIGPQARLGEVRESYKRLCAALRSSATGMEDGSV